MSGLILSGEVLIKQPSETAYHKLLNAQEFKVTRAAASLKERKSKICKKFQIKWIDRFKCDTQITRKKF